MPQGTIIGPLVLQNDQRKRFRFLRVIKTARIRKLIGVPQRSIVEPLVFQKDKRKRFGVLHVIKNVHIRKLIGVPQISIIGPLVLQKDKRKLFSDIACHKEHTYSKTNRCATGINYRTTGTVFRIAVL